MEIRQNLTECNYTPKIGRTIQYIVVHYTGNKGDTAFGNTKYFKSENRGASAHYFVDRTSVWQCVKDNDIAWHCGAKTYIHPKCRNGNSIGVELCDGVGGFDSKTLANAKELIRYLMQKYSIPIDNIVRHYDITGKECPKPFTDSPKDWEKFKKELEEQEMTEQERKQFNGLVEAVRRLQEQVDELKKPPMIYNYIDNNMPEWARPTVQKLLNNGVLKGTEQGLNLNEEILRMLVINDRAGLYD